MIGVADMGLFKRIFGSFDDMFNPYLGFRIAEDGTIRS